MHNELNKNQRFQTYKKELNIESVLGYFYQHRYFDRSQMKKHDLSEVLKDWESASYVFVGYLKDSIYYFAYKNKSNELSVVFLT